MAEPPSCSVTICSISSGSKLNNDAPGGWSSVSGSLTMMPSSAAETAPSMP